MTGTGGSLGLRSSSYGSLQQFQMGILPIVQTTTTPPLAPRNKPLPKMFKEKERLFLWICKFAPRKKIGMLLLCAVSAAVFLGVLFVGKGLLPPLLLNPFLLLHLNDHYIYIYMWMYRHTTGVN